MSLMLLRRKFVLKVFILIGSADLCNSLRGLVA